MNGKRYLGDGVYVSAEDGMLKLTTENGRSISNTIYLEGPVFDALIKYYEGLTGASVEDHAA